jgi:MOSC domain-containing protein YiiM
MACVIRLQLKVGHQRPMRRVAEVDAVAGMGLVGDVSYGRSRRQLLIVDQADLDRFGLPQGGVRENITLSGIPLAALARGTRLHLGQIVVEITGDCAPCEQIEELRPGLREAIRGRRGMLARVVEGGILHEGDLVSVAVPTP